MARFFSNSHHFFAAVTLPVDFYFIGLTTKCTNEWFKTQVEVKYLNAISAFFLWAIPVTHARTQFI